MNANKQQIIQFRVSTSEKNRVKKNAKLCNLSISDYLRASLNSTEIIRPPSEKEVFLTNALSEIGNEFNQLQYFIRSGKLTHEKALTRIFQLFKNLSNSLGTEKYDC